MHRNKSFLLLFFKKEETSFLKKRSKKLLVPFILVSFCIFGPWLWRVDGDAVSAGRALMAPSWGHPVGTDALGRDELARLMQGGVETLVIAVPATLLAFGFGVAYGLLAGFAPAPLARLMMLVLDALLALPSLVVLLCGASVLPLSGVSVAVLIGASTWFALARQVRTEIVALRHRDFALAARQLGPTGWHMARVHYMPNMGRLLAVNATFLFGDSVLALSALSFLGLGVAPPAASWGGMLQSGLGLVDIGAWWLILPPGLLITASLFAAAAAGQSLLAGRLSGVGPLALSQP
jgi:peptide/nickel transport system permease protein